MRARFIDPTIVATTGSLVILSIGLFSGCRSGQRFGGLVHVSAEPTADAPEIEAPAQRLASGKGTANVSGGDIGTDPVAQGSGEKQGVTGRPTASPQGNVISAAARLPGDATRSVPVQPASATVDSKSESRSSSFRISDQGDEATFSDAPSVNGGQTSSSMKTSQVVDRGISASVAPENATKRKRNTRATEQLLSREPSRRTPPKQASEASRPTVSGDRDSDLESNEKTPDSNHSNSVAKNAMLREQDAEKVLDAFSTSSPEVQQQALRQLLTLAASQARNSSQPTSIDELLREAMDNPIDLPEPRRHPSDLQTTRLGIRPSQNQTSEDLAARSEVSPENQDESAADSAVVPASASSDGGEDKRVSQAVDVSETSQSGKTKAVEQAVAQVSNALLSDEALFEMLIRRMRQPAPNESESERQRREVMIRHLLVMSGHLDSAVDQVEGLTKEEQEFLQHQLTGLWIILDPEGHPVTSRRFSSALPEMRAATKHLAASTDSLEVRSLAFCTEIEAYGQVKEFPSARFDAGQQVLLYCEVDNFAAKAVEGGFETRLQGSYTVYDSKNRKVVSQMLPADQQISRNYLRDYYIAYQMPIPSELEPGHYRLELTMEDLQGKKYGQSSIDLEVKP